MGSSTARSISRRRFMQFLAGSPLFASGAAIAQGLSPRQRLSDPLTWLPQDPGNLIKDPKDSINVFDFEPVARQNIPPAHFGYMASGVNDERTLRANREGFQKFQLRPRRLVDVSKVDTSTEILGVRYDTPIVICPIGGQKAFHPEGEVATARAAKAGNHLMMLSTVTTSPVEAVAAARGAPIWYQLYASNSWDIAKALVLRAEKAGCLAVAVTVDIMGNRIQDTQRRLELTDTRTCSGCPDRSSPQTNLRRRSMYEGIDVTGIAASTAMNWDFLKRLRDTTRMKILVKGILAHEGAKLAAVGLRVELLVALRHSRGCQGPLYFFTYS